MAGRVGERRGVLPDEILEQQSEHGGVRLLFSDKELIGMFAYAAEEGMEIREPLILPGRERCFEQSAAGLAGGRYEKIKVYGYPDAGIGQEKPLIMARIVHLPMLLRLFGFLRRKVLTVLLPCLIRSCIRTAGYGD